MVGPYSGVARITVLLARVFPLNMMVGPVSSRLPLKKKKLAGVSLLFMIHICRAQLDFPCHVDSLRLWAAPHGTNPSLHSKKTDDRIDILMLEKAIFILYLYARNTSVNKG